jgi:hypothetical protein
LSVDHQTGGQPELAQIGATASNNDDELLSPHQPSSPFGVFNHLRSSFKHYTSGKSRNNNKDIAS